jgi:hypothetical protein
MKTYSLFANGVVYQITVPKRENNHVLHDVETAPSHMITDTEGGGKDAPVNTNRETNAKREESTMPQIIPFVISASVTA